MNKKNTIMVLIVLTTFLASIMAVNAADYEIQNTNSVKGLLKNSDIDLKKENISFSVLKGKVKVGVGPITYSGGGSALLSMTTAKVMVNITTSNYKQIDYILLNGKRAFFSGSGINNGFSSVGSISFGSESYNISDLNFSKRNNGYHYSISKEVSLYELSKIQIVYKDQGDLKINKISKKKGNHIVTVSNAGDADVKSNKMGIFVGKQRIKTVTVPAIKVGKSKNVIVTIPSKYSKNKKTFKVDYNNKINEIYKNNNAKTMI